MLVFVKPDVRYQTQYLEMLDEWRASGEKRIPWVLNEDCSDFAAMTIKFERMAQGIGLAAGFVPNTTYWAYDDATDKIVGAVNIRHSLNEALLRGGGNVGYGVRPSERRKGYATRMLALALAECAKMGMSQVLVGCHRENIASARTILRNGGLLENEVLDEATGKTVQRYWIHIGPVNESTPSDRRHCP